MLANTRQLFLGFLDEHLHQLRINPLGMLRHDYGHWCTDRRLGLRGGLVKLRLNHRRRRRFSFRGSPDGCLVSLECRLRR